MALGKMTKAERISRAMERKAVDRPPVSFWRHFPDVDEDPFALAAALLAFQASYDLDFIKVMPTGAYCVEDWGCQVAYRGSLDGSRVCIDHAVKQPDDWTRVCVLDPEQGTLGRELTCLREVVKGRRDDAPVLQTVFSPLTIIKKLAGEERFLEDLRERPALIHAALDAVTETAIKVKMLGQNFVVFRDSNGQAHVLSNICTHRGGSLAHGKVKGDTVECPYHGWRYDGTGRVRAVPAVARASATGRRRPSAPGSTSRGVRRSRRGRPKSRAR